MSDITAVDTAPSISPKKNRLRAGANEMAMAEAMPYQQHWEWRTTWPLGDIISDELFLNLNAQLYPGDSITLCRYDTLANDRHRGSRLLEIVTVRVVTSGKEAVKLHVCGDIEIVTPPEELIPRVTGLEAHHKGRGKWAVLNSRGNEVATGLERNEAEAIAATGEIPPRK